MPSLWTNQPPWRRHPRRLKCPCQPTFRHPHHLGQKTTVLMPLRFCQPCNSQMCVTPQWHPRQRMSPCQVRLHHLTHRRRCQFPRMCLHRRHQLERQTRVLIRLQFRYQRNAILPQMQSLNRCQVRRQHHLHRRKCQCPQMCLLRPRQLRPHPQRLSLSLFLRQALAPRPSLVQQASEKKN